MYVFVVCVCDGCVCDMCICDVSTVRVCVSVYVFVVCVSDGCACAECVCDVCVCVSQKCVLICHNVSYTNIKYTRTSD